MHAHTPHHTTRTHPAEEFYVPGSSHRSWNKEWPVLRIMMRGEVCVCGGGAVPAAVFVLGGVIGVVVVVW